MYMCIILRAVTRTHVDRIVPVIDTTTLIIRVSFNESISLHVESALNDDIDIQIKKTIEC